MASMATTARVTAVDQVVDAITARIRNGSLVPGQRLVEADLTADLGVSRGPLREALSRLAAEGLVEIEPYRGALVRRLTDEEIAQLFDVREALEGMAARLAAVSVQNGADTTELSAALHDMEKLRERPDPYGYLEANNVFHDAIFKLSGNTLLQSHIAQLETHAYRLQFQQVLKTDARLKGIADHEKIAAAILAGNPRAAETEMRRHVRRSAETTEDMIRNTSG